MFEAVINAAWSTPPMIMHDVLNLTFPKFMADARVLTISNYTSIQRKDRREAFA